MCCFEKYSGGEKVKTLIKMMFFYPVLSAAIRFLTAKYESIAATGSFFLSNTPACIHTIRWNMAATFRDEGGSIRGMKGTFAHLFSSFDRNILLKSFINTSNF